MTLSWPRIPHYPVTAERNRCRLGGNVLLPFLLLALLFGAGSASAAAPPLLLADESAHSIAGHLELLVDPGTSLTFRDILTPANQTRFAAIPGLLNRGYTDDAIWVRLALLRREVFPEDPILRLWPAYLDTVTVYVQNGPQPSDPAAYSHYELGDHQPVSKRPVIDADFAVPLVLPANIPRFIYIRIRTSSSLNLAGAVETEADYITSGSYHAAFQGGYLAITLVIAAINLVLFLRLRDRLYLYFTLYLLFLFSAVFPASGLMALVFPSIVHRISDYMTGIGAACSLLFFSLFGKRLFQDCSNRRLNRYFDFLVLYSIVTALSIPVGYYSKLAPLLFVFSLSTILILTWLSCRLVRQKSEGALIYLAAFGISNIGYGAQFLRLLGTIPVAWWNMHAVEIASVCNMVLMTLAMTERVNRAEKTAIAAARAAEQNALRIAREMTVDLLANQKKLETSLERKVRFVEMVSHEYRTPLAIIRANLDILDLQHDQLGSGAADKIAKMQRAVSRLVEVIETSLITSRLQHGEPGQNRESVDAADFLFEILDEARDLWPGAELKLASGSLPTAFVTADPSLLKTAIFNLIDNAVKYAADYGAISLALTASSDEVRFIVADIGPGIPADEQEMIREKYRRGRAGIGRAGGGLGLFLVSKIVEEHGGRLELGTNTPRGLTAIIVLQRTE